MSDKEFICLPGSRLSPSDKTHVSGSGTYERNGYIYSMFAGYVKITEEENVSIIQAISLNDQSIVPVSGDIVTAKVIIVNQRFAKCVIHCIGDNVLTRPYRAMLRKEDVRATDIDKIEMHKCFRSGDVILARVLPVMDGSTCLISTAENELGVVIAYSEPGVAMVPISWTEMKCPKTWITQLRKVAKVRPEEITTTEI